MAMKKINLSQVVAVGHRDRDDILEVLVERNNEFEYVEVPAPCEAYSGLQDLSAAIEPTVVISLPDQPAELRQLPAASTSSIAGLDFEMRSVRSTMAKAVGYNATEQVLQIEFKNGSVYQYDDVEPETWTELWESDSIGITFNDSIKGHYSSKRCR
ncbi:MAG: KTSC domain-containing protein [Cyanobacteria bacterium P01_F01_bin.150]